VLRGLIEAITVAPSEAGLRIELKGELAAILALTSERPRAGAASGVCQSAPNVGSGAKFVHS